MSDGQRVPTALLGHAFLSLGVFVAILGAAMFLAAGDVRWVKGWTFIAVFSVMTIVSIFYLWHANPDIFIARSRFHPGMKRWDKVLVVFLLLSFLSIFPAAGSDAGQLHWSDVPLWGVALGYALLCIGYALSIWVYSVNKFAEPGVRIQSERGQTVIDKGPYAIVRHPLYSGALLMCAGIPLALGSYVAFIPAGVGAVILVVRTILEDRTLQRELAGYKEYTSRVRHRLIPGLW